MLVHNDAKPCLACLRADILAAGLSDEHFAGKTEHTCQPSPGAGQLAEILAAVDAVIEQGERGTIAEIRLVLGLRHVREALEHLVVNFGKE